MFGKGESREPVSTPLPPSKKIKLQNQDADCIEELPRPPPPGIPVAPATLIWTLKKYDV